MKSVLEQVTLAQVAQQKIADYSQQQADDMCLAVGWEMYNEANVEKLARLAVEETTFGNVPSKIAKHQRKIGGVLRDVIGAVSVGLMEHDAARGLRKYAKPVGVVCAILPATNPTATCGCNAISILKGRNAVIFKASSRALRCTAMAVAMIRSGLERVGAPPDLVQLLEDSSRDGSTSLMQESDLVVATGSGAVVRAAYASGTPALGVGQGNAVVIVAEDAAPTESANMIYASKTFDFSTSCSSENAVIVVDAVYEAFLRALQEKSVHLVQGEARTALQHCLWPRAGGPLNIEALAKSATHIADLAGLTVPHDTELLLVEGRIPFEEDPFYQEKNCPVLTLYRVTDFAQACTLLQALTRKVGRGHSCGIHTHNRAYIDWLGEHMPTSRVTVRQPMSVGNGGHAGNGMPATATLGCGTWGGNSTTENIHWRHFLNVTWVNEPIAPTPWDVDALWKTFHQKYPR